MTDLNRHLLIQSQVSYQLDESGMSGGTGGTRTLYLFHAMEALSQLSYGPSVRSYRDLLRHLRAHELVRSPL